MNNADRAWIDALYKKNYTLLLHQAARRLGNDAYAPDAVNIAFETLLIKFDEVKNHPNPEAWLMRTINYVILRELERRHREVVMENIPDTLIINTNEGTEPLSNSLPSGLTPSEKELLILYYEEQLSHEEIAKRLNVSVATCWTRLFRAKKHCKKLMENEKNNLSFK